MALKALGTWLPRLTRTALGRRGAEFAGLAADWALAVGPRVAAVCAPAGLSRNGVLTLHVEGAAAVELQHLAPQIAERVNLRLGRPAVQRIRLVRSPLPDAPARVRQPRANAPADLSAVERQLDGIADPGLADALRRLGRTLAARG